MTIKRGEIYLDSTRFDSQLAGHLTENKMIEIETAVRYCLGL